MPSRLYQEIRSSLEIHEPMEVPQPKATKAVTPITHGRGTHKKVHSISTNFYDKYQTQLADCTQKYLSGQMPQSFGKFDNRDIFSPRMSGTAMSSLREQDKMTLQVQGKSKTEDHHGGMVSISKMIQQ